MRFLSWRFLFKFFTITKQRGLPRNMIYFLSMHQLLTWCQEELEPRREGQGCTREPETRPVLPTPSPWPARPQPVGLAGPQLRAPALGWLRQAGPRASSLQAYDLSLLSPWADSGQLRGGEPAPRTSQLPKWPFPSSLSGGRQLPFPGKLIPNAGIWAQVHELGLPSSLFLAHPGTHTHPGLLARNPLVAAQGT